MKIPPGVETGSRLRVNAEGEIGENGGPPGDLCVVITVKEHRQFTREGDHILYEAPIHFVRAILGTKIDVPTMVGDSPLKIPAGTQDGKVFRLKGLGFANLRGHSPGDQLVRIRVEIPTKLTAKQKELLEEFAKISGEPTDPDSGKLFEKVKNLFE